uniref:Uncharacterized protein n=1 Tax=Rhizophora mucronata TaxID=61149 RepID=A0A2P2QGV2_RHIMU
MFNGVFELSGLDDTSIRYLSLNPVEGLVVCSPTLVFLHTTTMCGPYDAL